MPLQNLIAANRLCPWFSSYAAGKARKVGYFKPIVNTPPEEKKDAHIETVLSYFGLRLSYADSYAFTRAQAMRYMETSSGGEMMDAIIRKFKKLEDESDFTVNRE